MISKKGVIIFDGDDTLWRTQELYDSAKAQFEKFMRMQGFFKDNIIQLLDELDAKRVEIARFSKTRFFESMLIAYAIFCGKYNKKWDISIESKIRQLGHSVFASVRLYDESMPTLKMLYKYFSLILFTNGDEEIQREKIDSLGKKFKAFFSEVYIPEIKNEKEFKKIINDLNIPIKKVWVVGNSIKSDINPALRLGLKTILIPQGIWKYEESELYSDDVVVVNSLKEATEVIMEKTYFQKE